MENHLQRMEDPARWCSEKVDFVTSVVGNVDGDVLRDLIMSCTSENDVEILLQNLLEDSDDTNSKAIRQATGGGNYGGGGATAPPLPLPRSYETEDYYDQESEVSQAIPRNGGAIPKANLSIPSRETTRHPQNEGAVESTDEELEDRVMTQVVTLAEMFKDADPDFLQKKCWEIKGNPDRLMSVVQKLLRDKDYPKIDNRNKRQKEKEFQSFIENLSAQEYLSFIEDPEENESEPDEQDCGICYSGVATLDMITCNSKRDQHKFCCDCIKRFVEEEIGQGKSSFRCPDIDCQGTIRESDLEQLLSEAVLNKVRERRQQEEIDRADIEDLESCPFCDFKVIMPNKHDKVFLCLNPGCMKDSCRSCKELSHIPKSCKEVLAEKQKDVRTMLENRMAEAMIRECVKCKKRFIIEAGCNKMVCPCGAIMCYLCKEPIQGYDHFTNNPQDEPHKCPLWTNSTNLHGDEVREAAAQARRELDPDLDLVYDPTRDVDTL